MWGEVLEEAAEVVACQGVEEEGPDEKFEDGSILFELPNDMNIETRQASQISWTRYSRS